MKFMRPCEIVIHIGGYKFPILDPSSNTLDTVYSDHLKWTSAEAEVVGLLSVESAKSCEPTLSACTPPPHDYNHCQ